MKHCRTLLIGALLAVLTAPGTRATGDDGTQAPRNNRLPVWWQSEEFTPLATEWNAPPAEVLHHESSYGHWRLPEIPPGSVGIDRHFNLPTNAQVRRKMLLFAFEPILPTRPWHTIGMNAGSSRDLPGLRMQIPAFFHGDQIMGPYSIGEPNFEPKAYPIKIPVFRHLYESINPESMDFELFAMPNRVNRQHKQLETTGTLFYPEPERLGMIQNTIWSHLQHLKRDPVLVFPDSHLSVYEGEWLWPSTEPASHLFSADHVSLQMPANELERLRRVISDFLRGHYARNSIMYHMTVQTVGGGRHILTMQVPAERYFPGLKTPNSGLWLFFEGLKFRGPKLAFLGASFFPQETKDALLEAKAIWPAFPTLVS
ncbi:uncharacterized protein UTRI_10398_B [Ustilago trichophora]|uniref:Uncharacterized protein n=1 Tax=Ustilago trichophora TaxID=86804 RepID=A0A5C3EA74_9BASI|nr:uncharacterized protein UTRI_10398_B [Ustilago trichophora]